MVLDSIFLTTDSLVRALVILAVGLLLLFSSVITLCVLLNNSNLQSVVNVYLTSLALNDFFSATLIVPLSFYSSITPNWNFMGDNSILCKLASYTQIVLISSTSYTFAWIGVDRYSAFMKPSRYDNENTLTRCKFWIAFSWITAIFLACPVIFAKMEINYYHDFEMCVLNWSTTSAYSITLAVLVFLPTTLTVAFTCGSVFNAMSKPEELEDIQKTIVETDENFIVTLFVLITFVLAWLPIIVIELLPSNLIHPVDLSTMKFAFMWLAVGGSSAKLLIYTCTNAEFRLSLRTACLKSIKSDNSIDNFQFNNTPRENWSDRKMFASNNYLLNNPTNIEYSNQRQMSKQIDKDLSCCCRGLLSETEQSPIQNNMAKSKLEYGSFLRSPIKYY